MNPFKQKDKENKAKSELKKLIEDRIKEYDLAIEYFKENNLPINLVKGQEDKKILVESLEKVNSGKVSEVNEKNLPKEITPEYICGYSNDERIKKYFEIITKIIAEKQKLQTELENEIKELKKLSKDQILSMKDEIQKDFEKIKNKKIKYDEIINILKEDFQNKWIPAPLYSETEEDTNVEVIKEDIPENTLRIEFSKTDYAKNKKVILTAELEGTNHKEEWEQKAVNDWSHTIDWQLSDEEYKNLPTKVLFFQVNEKLRGNKNKFKGDGRIKLDKLENENEYSGNFEFTLKTKRMVPHVKIDFKIRKCLKPQYEPHTKRIFCFTKFYPPFKE